MLSGFPDFLCDFQQFLLNFLQANESLLYIPSINLLMDVIYDMISPVNSTFWYNIAVTRTPVANIIGAVK